jgi:Type VIII secretion system (T8SS), CsgF protein
MYKLILLFLIMVSDIAFAAPLPDFAFKNPAFNGNGYGTYVLTIENEEYTRQQSINQAVQAAAQQAATNASNQPINQFLTNLESRIYAQISQNAATAMFSGGSSSCPSQGACTFQFDSNTSISWWWAGTNMVMQVTQPSGTSQITIPMGQFNMTTGN